MKVIKLLSPFTALAALGAICLSSCSPVTPQNRIEKNQAIYDKLSDSDKKLVQQGKIKKGMHKEGVFLAWGKAQSVTQGEKDNKKFEQWVYTSISPVYHSSFGTHYGYSNFGHRGFGHRGFSRGGFRHGGFGHGGFRGGFGHGSFGHSVAYRQQRSATVSFDHYGKVKSWAQKK